MTSELFDVIIIGGGPAGLTAAIYASRMGLRTVLLEKELFGGRAVYAPMVENFPGFPEGISGVGLTDRMLRQVEKFGTSAKAPEEVLDMCINDVAKKVTTRTGQYRGLALIIATGTQRKKLSVAGENEFLGRGVSYCAVCDGPLFRGKRTAIVGYDDEALEDSLHLSEFAGEVILITQNDELEAAEILVNKFAKKANAKILKAKIEAIIGDSFVKAITISDLQSNREEEIPVDGVFISVGGAPMTNVVRKMGTAVDERGCSKVDRRQTTNLEGVYAAGDCTCGGMQMVTAVGEGALAAMQAYRYVRTFKK